MSHVCIARGVRGHAPPKNFLKTVQFGAFLGVFDQILSLFFFKLPFFICNFFFRYTLAMGYFS